MRLIPCPDCGRDVSARAPACPHCGLAEPGVVRAHELAEAQRALENRIKMRSGLQSFGILLLLFALTARIAQILPLEHRPKAGIGFFVAMPAVIAWRYYAAKRHYREKSNNG